MEIEIPEGWKLLEINKFSEVISGSTPRTSNPEFWNGNIIWITPDDLGKNSEIYVDSSSRKISELGLKNSSAKLIPEKSIVISSRAPIGYLAIVTSKYTTNQGCKSLRLFDSIIPEYIYYALYLNINFIKRMGEGTTFAEISKTELEKISILIPISQLEQEKIAKILLDVDYSIYSTRNLIKKYERIKKGLMQDLFTKGIDENGNIRSGKTRKFWDSPLGKIPLEWEIRTIDKICELKGRIGWRGYKVKDLRDSGPLVIGATQIDKKNRIDLSNPVHISIEKYEESPEIQIEKGNIIVVKTGNSIGKVAYICKDIGPACINPNTALLKDIRINNLFLYYSLIHPYNQKQIWDFVAAGAQPAVNQTNLKSMKLKLPRDLGEQNKIVKILSNIDKKISITELCLIKLESIKRGLMQDLLTGKVRVNNLIKQEALT